MTTIAPMSSAIANASRNSLSHDGTRRPSSATTPATMAMSVAIGIPHPRDPLPPAFSIAKITAGAIIPPNAAMTGSAACFGSRSSPCVTSRLISRPATKKNSTIARSLIQSRSVSVNSCVPNDTLMSVPHSSK